MWWSDRRTVLLGGCAALAGCGFAPVYGPDGAANTLLGTIALKPARDENSYRFNRRFEERLGRGAPGAPLTLSVKLETSKQDMGSTSTGNTTRHRLIGRAIYSLTDSATGATRLEGRTNAFTGYSTTGSTVATRAAEVDAEERLMVLLADQVIDDLLLSGVSAG